MTLAVDLGRKATKQTNKYRALYMSAPGYVISVLSFKICWDLIKELMIASASFGCCTAWKYRE